MPEFGVDSTCAHPLALTGRSSAAKLDYALDAAKHALIDAPSRVCVLVESHPKFDARVRIYGLDPKPMAELKH